MSLKFDLVIYATNLCGTILSHSMMQYDGVLHNMILYHPLIIAL